MKDYITLGRYKEDGDFDIVATFNLDNSKDRAERTHFESVIKSLAFHQGLEILEIQSSPDTLTL